MPQVFIVLRSTILNQLLKIEDGQAAFPDGPPAWPEASDAVVASINHALASGQWGLYEGELLQQTHAALQEMWGLENSLLCSSGTVAVELAIRAAGVKADDEVVLAAYDFPGNFRAIEAIGARPVLVDVLPDRWTMDAQQLKAAFSPRTRAVLVSHLHGETADIEAIVAIAKDAEVPVVEDVCQSPGAMLNGRMLGTFGNVASLSFGGSKLLSAGRGGAVLCNDESMLQRARIFAHRGNDAFPFSQIQAALLLPQLDQLEELNQRRLSAVQKVTAALTESKWLQSLEEQGLSERGMPAFYKVPIRIREEAPFDRASYLAVVEQEGIMLAEGFRGFAKRSARRCRSVGDLKHSRSAAAQTMLLHHPILLSGDSDIDRLIETLGRVERYFIR